jgi:hypothetical protein
MGVVRTVGSIRGTSAIDSRERKGLFEDVYFFPRNFSATRGEK